MHSESNTKCLVVEMHQWWIFHIVTEWKPIHYFACGLEIPLSRTAKPSIYTNHGFEKTWSQNSLVTSEENSCFGHTDLFFRFSTRSEGILLDSHHYHIVRKKSLVKDLKETEIHKISGKSKAYDSKFRKPKSDTNRSHSQEYSDLQDIFKSYSCLEILRMVVRVNVSVFQITGNTRGTKVLIRVTLEHGW